MQEAATGGTGTLEAAHKALLQRRDLQFELKGIEVPPPREPPRWWQAIMDFLSHLFAPLGPVLQGLFWGVVALAVLGIVYLIAREVGWLDWTGKAKKAKAREEAYRPGAEMAASLLADADALAAQGRYAEAVHILLLRSIEDMQRFRPGSVRPAATSRDLARLPVLPGEARPLFAAMASRVEVSLFGARPVDAAGYAASRADYEAFAFPRVWA